MSKILFWEKSAKPPEEEDLEKIVFNDVEEDESIRELIRSLEEKSISKKLNFSNIKPKNSSVKKFILNIIKSYPNPNSENVEFLIDSYRSELVTRSKEEGRFIMGVLQLKDVLVLAHCKKDPSLAEIKDKMYSVKTVLHPKNIIRADIIKKEDGIIYFSAFEASYRFSKSHASFWGIEPEDVGWESLGRVNFIIESETIDFPLQVSIDPEGIKEMFDNKKISTLGKIKLGKEEGKITKAFLFGRCLSFPAFYDFYVAENEKLIPFKKKFEELIKPQTELTKINNNKDWYKNLYEENVNELFKIGVNGRERIMKKNHPRFVVGFFTKTLPGIKPNHELILKIYQSIFHNSLFSFCHIGELVSGEPLKFGLFEVYNNVKIKEEILEFMNSLLNQIQDSEGKKIKLILQKIYCATAYENIENKNFKHIFSFLQEEVIDKEIESEFESDGLLAKEDIIEFKSADKVSNKPKEFSKKIIEEIKKYTKERNISRYCILYGIEDNNRIKPNYNFPNDSFVKIEKDVNEEIKKMNLKVQLYPIPYKEGKIISVFIIPSNKNENSNKIQTN